MDRIDELIEAFDDANEKYSQYPTTMTYDTYRSSRAALRSEYDRLLARIAELEAAQKWISVDERLPENYVDVDILWRYDGHDDLNYDVTRKLEDETMLITRDGDFDKRVMFWKYPIPRPVTP